MSRYVFTSESVSEGHPDKLADQISDLVLDALLEKDRAAKVACEVFVRPGFVLVGGEVATTGWVDLEPLIRQRLREVGYTSAEIGLDSQACAVVNLLGRQSPDIRQGVERCDPTRQGAGDQGLMFGYATSETDSYMPAPIAFAHALVQRQAELKKAGALPWLRPDAKSQVTVSYESGRPVAIESVVLSTQHGPEATSQEIEEGVMELIIKPILANWVTPQTRYFINPTGRFVIGGPAGDCGLTGRKIIVDTYGGMARHGGGAFSGKDPSKVDRSAAYMARYIAKNLVAAKLASRCEVQLSYAIGVAEPVSVSVETFGTGRLSCARLEKLVRAHFPLTPYGIIESLSLLRPIYLETAVLGHFGRPVFSWEACDKVDCLAEEV